MKKKIDITVNLESKAIIVSYQDTETGAVSKRGYDPTVEGDWDLVEEDSEVNEYKIIAWNGLEKPTEQEFIEEDLSTE